ncbi:MAG: cytochrome c1 [Acidiferrobacterales bacterium]
MRNIYLAICIAFIPAAALAAESTIKFDPVEVDLKDKPSLRRGARIFVNYCLSCHSAAYMRYDRMGRDLGISEELVEENLMFATDKVGNLMTVTMPRADAETWFGVAPPDLTLVTRSRGPQWFYNYMRSFYRDPKTVSGWNNLHFPDVAMPNVLYGMQGVQRAVFEPKEDGTKEFQGFEVERPGAMTPNEFDQAMRDLTNFMVYLGEPARLVRGRIGVYVLIFLAVFFVFAYLLKRNYWKDIH